MANNQIILDLKVDDKGSLVLTTKKAQKTTKALNDATDASERHNKSRNRYQRLEKGAAGITSNSTKAFA